MDHAGAVADLAEQKNIPIEGPHKEEKFWIDNLPEQGKMFGLGADQTYRTFIPTRWLDDGDTVSVGNQTCCFRAPLVAPISPRATSIL